MTEKKRIAKPEADPDFGGVAGEEFWGALMNKGIITRFNSRSRKCEIFTPKNATAREPTLKELKAIDVDGALSRAGGGSPLNSARWACVANPMDPAADWLNNNPIEWDGYGRFYEFARAFGCAEKDVGEGARALAALMFTAFLMATRPGMNIPVCAVLAAEDEFADLENGLIGITPDLGTADGIAIVKDEAGRSFRELGDRVASRGALFGIWRGDFYRKNVTEKGAETDGDHVTTREEKLSLGFRMLDRSVCDWHGPPKDIARINGAGGDRELQERNFAWAMVTTDLRKPPRRRHGVKNFYPRIVCGRRKGWSADEAWTYGAENANMLWAEVKFKIETAKTAPDFMREFVFAEGEKS